MHKGYRARGIIGGVFAGLLFIWTGVSFYLKTSGMLTWSEWGMYYPLGLAGIFLMHGIAWLAIPGMRKVFIGMLIPSVLLTVVGLIPLLGGGWHAWGTWWPFIIVAVGLVIMISAIWGVLSRYKKKAKDK